MIVRVFRNKQRMQLGQKPPYARRLSGLLFASPETVRIALISHLVIIIPWLPLG